MAQHDILYKHAMYYDIALSRCVGPEADFVAEVHRVYTGTEMGGSVKSCV